MGRPRKRRRDSGHIQEGGNIDGIPDQEYAADQLHLGQQDVSTVPSLGITAPTLNVPQNLDPTLGPSGDWNSVHTANSNGYELTSDVPGSNTASDGTLNDLNDVDPPGQYPDLSNAASTGYACPCLDQLHSMLQSFQLMPPTSFPTSRDPLTRATKLARAVNQCTLCPLDFPTALQTSMLLTTLLRLVVHGYATLVRDIQTQAAGERKITYRVGELSLSNAHMHTGTLDCPMGFNIELEPEEWAAMARKVLKQDIHGNSQNMDCFIGVVEEFQQRHQTWQLLQFPFSDTNAAVRSQHTQPQPQELVLQLLRHIREVAEDLEL